MVSSIVVEIFHIMWTLDNLGRAIGRLWKSQFKSCQTFQPLQTYKTFQMKISRPFSRAASWDWLNGKYYSNQSSVLSNRNKKKCSKVESRINQFTENFWRILTTQRNFYLDSELVWKKNWFKVNQKWFYNSITKIGRILLKMSDHLLSVKMFPNVNCLIIKNILGLDPLSLI